MINQHGLNSIIYKKLKNYKYLFEDKFIEKLELSYMNIIKDNILLTFNLKFIDNLFGENNIKYLSFKGPGLSILAYGDVASRRYLDLDILVKEDDLIKTYEILEKNGYKSDTEKKYIKNKVFLNIAKDILFYNDKKNVKIEVHWQLFEKRFFFQNYSLNDTAWEKVSKIQISDFYISTFNKEYLIFYLIIHGSKHFWERIEWLYNIYLILNHDKKIDLNKILDYAKVMKAEMMIKIFFVLIKIKFDYKVDENIINLNCKSYKLAQKIENNWTVIEDKYGINFKEIEFMISMQDNFFNKLHVIYKTIFQIKVNDIFYINLPEKLIFIYYLIRPIRFLKDYLKR